MDMRHTKTIVFLVGCVSMYALFIVEITVCSALFMRTVAYSKLSIEQALFDNIIVAVENSMCDSRVLRSIQRTGLMERIFVSCL